MNDPIEPGTVLVVDPDREQRDWLAAGLTAGAHRPVSVRDAEAASEHLARTTCRPAVVVLHLAPDEAAAFLERARVHDPDLGAVLIIPTAHRTSTDRSGLPGTSLLVEPVEMVDLLQAIALQVRRRIERAADARWHRRIGAVVDGRLEALERRLERYAVASLEVLVTALEARDPYLHGHSQRVSHLSAALADAMGRPEGEVEAVRLAGRLHDIGMLAISELVVNHGRPLTQGERDQVQQHPVVGHQVLLPYAHLAEVGRFVRAHHERWDGEGYPDGLAGLQIPWGGRVIAVVESYDAMITSRAHRQDVLGGAEAMRAIQRLAGSAFDPAIVTALTHMIGERRALDFVPERVGWPTPAVASEIPAA